MNTESQIIQWKAEYEEIQKLGNEMLLDYLKKYPDLYDFLRERAINERVLDKSVFKKDIVEIGYSYLSRPDGVGFIRASLELNIPEVISNNLIFLMIYEVPAPTEDARHGIEMHLYENENFDFESLLQLTEHMKKFIDHITTHQELIEIACGRSSIEFFVFPRAQTALKSA